MGRGRTLGALLGAITLAASLAACGGDALGSGEGIQLPDLEKLRDDYVGSWELSSAEFEGMTITEDDYAEFASLGMHVTLDLDDSGALLVDAFGEQDEGSWEIADEDTLSLTLGSDTVDVPFEDGELTLTYDGETMVFEKVSNEPNMDRDPAENSGDGLAEQIQNMDETLEEEGLDDGSEDVDEIDLTVGSGEPESLADLLSDEWILQTQLYVATVTITDELDVVVCDDETAKITIDGIGYDVEGDTGYHLVIENRSDTDYLVSNITTTLDGEDVWMNATLGAPVRAGETVEGFFYFEQDEGLSVTPESSCEFILGLYDADETLLGFYEVSL